MTNIVLRDYQEDAVVDIRAAFRRHEDPVLFQLPTGGGKTYTFCYIALHAAKKGNTVFIIVHRDELLRQASKALHNLGIPHGMISPKFTPDPYQHIQVCSVDTLLNRLKKHPGKYQPDLAVFDEGHHVTQKNKWGKAYTLLGEPRTLLVTATPSRGDGIGMGTAWGGICKSLVKGPSVSLLIERGMLIEPIVYAGKIIPDFSKLKTNKDGEYNENELAALTDKKEITGNSVEHYTAICPGVRAVVFCANIVHAKHVAEEFCAAGYKFKLLVGKPEMSDTERDQVVREISTGAIQGICVVDLVSEGFDVPALKCCIMLRHVGHITQFLQMIGRVMRPDGTDAQAYCLDHVGNVGVIVDNVFVPKHGLPSQDREWTLEGRAKGKKKAPKENDIKLKQCKHCYFVFQLEPECPTCIENPHHTHTPNEPHCPACGEALPAQKTRKEAEEKDGTLGQVTADMARIQQMRRRREIAQARTLEELESYAAAHGYSKGWAWHTYNARKKKVS